MHRARWGPLHEAGIGIHEYQPTMFHRKVLVVDTHFVSVGSTNFDNRSFHLNDEANLNIYDDAFAQRAAEVFAADSRHTRRITLEEWTQRRRQEKLMDKLASLLGPQL